MNLSPSNDSNPNDPVARLLAQATTQPTHVATLNGGVARFHQANYDEAIAELVAKHGPGVPDVRPIAATMTHTTDQDEADFGIISGGKFNGYKISEPAPVEAPAKKLEVGEYDAAGDARSQRDREAAVDAGFAPAQPVYRQGSRATGMREHRQAFEALPLAHHAATRLINKVQSERREDVELLARDVRVNKEGRLALGRRRLLFTGRSFTSLVARLGMPPGASSYLPAIEPEIRAFNLNHWVTDRFMAAEAARALADYQAEKPHEPAKLVFRTRDAARPASNENDLPSRECYGVVSDSYGEFDADKIAEAIRMAVPEDARARVTYDGHRTKFDVVFFSNVPVDQAVAGEFFKAAVQIRTDDAGGGSIVVSAALHQNLCLNFIVLDEAFGAVDRIRHLGSTEKLAKRFKKAFAEALEKISHFTKAWGYAQEEAAHIGALVAAKNTNQISAEEFNDFRLRPVSEMLPGIFNGIIERELAPLPKKDRQRTVGALMDMWRKDESAATRDREAHLSRAAVVNALTRYAHEVNANPFLESAIESAAGGLLVGRNGQPPAPLPFVPLEA